MEYQYSLEFTVRDYECDLQGIVNNSVYQNYLEHCRHKFLQFTGIDFAQLHNEGIDAVVIRAEIDYKFPLKPGDSFVVRLKILKQGNLRVIFDQSIIRKSDEKQMLKAKIISVLTRNGRPLPSSVLIRRFEDSGIVIPEA